MSLTRMSKPLIRFLIVLMVIGSCARKQPESPAVKTGYLAELNRYRSSGSVARPLLPLESTWRSEWMPATRSAKVIGYYGIPTDYQYRDIVPKSLEGVGEGHKRGGPVVPGVVAQTLQPVAQSCVSGHLSPAVRFVIAIEVEGLAPSIKVEEVLTRPESKSKDDAWRRYELDAPSALGTVWRLVCKWIPLDEEGADLGYRTNSNGSLREEGAFAVPRLMVKTPTPPRTSGPEGIILISVDTLRADHLGAYGYPRSTSPVADALARKGTLFSGITSTSSWTLPAHVSIFTGQSAVDHGVRKRSDFPVSLNHSCLAEEFFRNGWRTAAFTGGGYVAPVWGMERGFEVYDYRPGGAKAIFTRAGDWLETVGTDRFFLFIHHYDVHLPYNESNDRPVMAAGKTSAGVTNTECPISLSELVDLYDDGIFYTDRLLGKFLNRIKAFDHAATPIIVFLSDHGDELADHGGYSHGHTLYHELLSVPLIVSGPGIPAGVSAQQESLTYVYPLLCGLAGIRSPHGEAADRLTSVLTPSTVAEAYGVSQIVSVIEGSDKFILSPERGLEYYNLADNPAERVDSSAQLALTAPWSRFLWEISKGDRGRLQAWFFHGGERVTGTITASGKVQYPRCILAQRDSVLQNDAQGLRFELNPLQDVPMVGISFMADTAEVVSIELGARPLPELSIYVGYSLQPAHPGNGLLFPPAETIGTFDQWDQKLTTARAKGLKALLLHPAMELDVAERVVPDESLEEQLRGLGYLE